MNLYGPATALIAAAALSVPAPATAAVHTYRFVLDTISGDARNVDPVKQDAPGTTQRVTTDSRGRVLRVDTRRGGKTLSSDVYSYSPGASKPDGFLYYRAGRLLNRVKIARNSNGYRTRVTWYTSTGKLSTIRFRAIRGNTVNGVSKTASGSQLSRYVDTFDASGVAVAETVYEQDGSYFKYTFSPVNGKVLTDAVFVHGKLNNTSKTTYDSNGDILRKESFGANGVKFFEITYRDGLPIRRIKLGFHRYETTLHHNALRILTSADFSVDGTLVCRFVYQRAADGLIQRTLAYSPEHQLWAVYPNTVVEDVHADGSAIFGKPGKIYHTSDWY